MKTIRNKKDPAVTGAMLEQFVAGRDDWGSKSTRQGYESLVKQMRAFDGAGFATRGVDETYCRELRDFLLGRLKPSSVRGYLERLSTLLRTARREGLVGELPKIDFPSLMPPREGAEKVFLTRDELLRMRHAECPAESTKDAFLFSCYTGLLKGEVQELRWDAIRLSGSGLVLTRPVENSGETVRVPVVEPAREILQDAERRYATLPQEQRDERVFHLYSGMTVNEHIKRWARNAHVEKNVNFMTSRHTFATMALRAGVDLYVLARWCGLSNVASAEVYADLIGGNSHSDSELLEAAFS